MGAVAGVGAWGVAFATGQKISLEAANKPLESFVHCGGIYTRSHWEKEYIWFS